MYFIDRLNLGVDLAKKLQHVRGQNAIVVCLKESSLLTCIAMSMHLRSWIYPLIYEPIMNPDDPQRPIGAITQDGDFCLAPGTSQEEYEYLTSEFNAQIEERKRQAMHVINQRLTGYGKPLDRHVMNGRTVILAGDVITEPLLLAVSEMLLKPLAPGAVYGIAGNVSIDVSDLFHLSTDQVDVLDVLSGTLFDDDHYFERPDAYTDEQKHALALNIATFWQ